MGEGGVLSRSRAGVSNSWFLQHPHPCEGKVASCWEVDTNDTAPPQDFSGVVPTTAGPQDPTQSPPAGAAHTSTSRGKRRAAEGHVER